MRREFPRLAHLVAGLLAAGTLACSGTTEPEPTPPKVYPQGTPEQLVQSFVESYEDRNIAEYSKLFAGDFTFEFSNAADPNLVAHYASGWHRIDEITAASRLFHGGTNSDGVYQESASRITVGLPDSIPEPDTTRGDSAYAYRIVHTPAILTVEVPGDIVYVIPAVPPQPHWIYLVRGDFAAGLTPDQPADSAHWYIYHWKDESGPLKRFTTSMNSSSTWGRLKALYR